ncbi:MAG TPA: GIY-YIG nuclease family protein [Gammaproteobacteria bacterium]|nr:GIY-YIG nuclease family protein [Gammaproteobacteria bacterium]
MPDFWVYILYCKNEHFYVGYTADLIKRYRLHVKGKAARYTRSFPPCYLAQVWPIYGSKQQAMQLERILKRMQRSQKQVIVDAPEILEQLILKQIIELD